MPPSGTLSPPRIFVSRAFRRWQLKAGLPDRALAVVVAEMRAGLIDAELGGGRVKKRVAVAGGGKRGGARVIVATYHVDRWFYLFGFLKCRQANISVAELAALRTWATELLALENKQLDAASREGRLHEIDPSPENPH